MFIPLNQESIAYVYDFKNTHARVQGPECSYKKVGCARANSSSQQHINSLSELGDAPEDYFEKNVVFDRMCLDADYGSMSPGG